MPSRFRHAAIVGKFQARGIRPMLEEIAHFLVGEGLEVSFERDTALATGITEFDAVPADRLGEHCDIAIVVGGDGTMLGIAREVAPPRSCRWWASTRGGWASSPTSPPAPSARRWRR